MLDEEYLLSGDSIDGELDMMEMRMVLDQGGCWVLDQDGCWVLDEAGCWVLDEAGS